MPSGLKWEMSANQDAGWNSATFPLYNATGSTQHNLHGRYSMAIDGTYKVDINSPMGTQSFTLTLKTDGNSLSGSSAGFGGTQEFGGGTVDGNDFAFSMDFSGPMGQMQLDIKGTVDGDDISGQVQFSALGTAPFKGSRYVN